MTPKMDLPIGMILDTVRQVLSKVWLEVPKGVLLELSSSSSAAVSSVSFVVSPLLNKAMLLMMDTHQWKVKSSQLPPMKRFHHKEILKDNHKFTVIKITSCN
jgi:hypothetical protein